MNKARFIERLNLHLDGELNEEETSELFRAMRRSEEYQRIYRQYCQIYSACSQLGENFANERKPSLVIQRIYAIGGLAAAFALLGLAAQNLAPVIGLDAGPKVLAAADATVDLEVAEPLSTNAAPEDRFVVLNVDELQGRPVLVDNVQLASFDVDAAFDASLETGAATPGVSFVSYEPAAESVAPESRWKRPFLLDQPTSAGTFQHEALSAREATALGAAFSGNAFPAAAAVESASKDGRVRFDMKRAELAPVTGVDAQVSPPTNQ